MGLALDKYGKSLEESEVRTLDVLKIHQEGKITIIASTSGIYTSNDNMKTWIQRSATPVNTVYGYGNNFYAGDKLGLQISRDCGETWYRFPIGEAVKDLHAYKDATSNGCILAVTDKHLYYSRNNGYDWQAEDLELGDYTIILYPTSTSSSSSSSSSNPRAKSPIRSYKDSDGVRHYNRSPHHNDPNRSSSSSSSSSTD